MTRKEFLRLREIANHIKTQGVVKVAPGEAKGTEMFGKVRLLKTHTSHRLTASQTEIHIDEESGQPTPGTRKTWVK
jgi:hypothetical protein